jgi:hypothetical protein
LVLAFQWPLRAAPVNEPAQVTDQPERRQRWSLEEKLRILAQSVSPGSSASLVCRLHGISSGHGFTIINFSASAPAEAKSSMLARFFSASETSRRCCGRDLAPTVPRLSRSESKA